MNSKNVFIRRFLLVLAVSLSWTVSFASAQNASAPTTKPLPVITIQGDKFVADGKEFKIWGFNQGYGLNLSDTLLQKNVDQLAFLGCNMLRLHSLDWTLFGEAVPGAKAGVIGLLPMGADRPNTQTLVNVDNFYRLMNALRKKGIYVAITLSVCSTYVPGDSDILTTTPEDTQAWEKAISEVNSNLNLHIYKMLPVFDERSLELRKKWASNLLRMRNPETGVKLAEDPQLAFLNVVNECSMYSAFARNNFMSTLPEYFRKKVRDKWNAWLKKKYGSEAEIASAWKEDGKKGLLADESIENNSVDLIPVDPIQLATDEEKKAKSYEYYSQQRKNDFLRFLFEMDTAHQRIMIDHFKALGWTRPSGYCDAVGIDGNQGAMWLKSDLMPYVEEHPYDEGQIDLFHWDTLRVCTYCGANFVEAQGPGRPIWASEIRDSMNGLCWTRIPFCLYVAVYHSLQGRDGCTWHAWSMKREQLITDELNLLGLSMFDCNWDIPWLYSYRAAGRLFRSCEIKELPKNDPALQNFSQWKANFTNDQIHRIPGENRAIMTVNTDHFRVVATPYPQTVQLGDVTVNLTSKTYNVVYVEKLSDNEIEITAVGKCGNYIKDQANQFGPIEWVSGSVRIDGRTIKSVQHINYKGEVLETLQGPLDEIPFENGVCLYRAILN